ncbi:hypothetical protein OK349_01955 [Sphingomonas sp. BT-65]|uniref:hypothetical protein n=1 Tax=Sphingomonas sp. BT-65 TaxID=2989821 RepID=UPI002235B710|nr:hypothetical protein [Sphingomonas sp. BT-65]MCW4460454.1 hypothetical protein [Sphingomonas sp. BT-65]
MATVAEGLALSWLDAKTADIVASRAIYGIAAEFDLSEPLSRAATRMTQLIGALLGTIPDARFADRDAVAFMLAALLGGSVRVVMEGKGSQVDLACLRRELPRMCHAYLAASRSGHHEAASLPDAGPLPRIAGRS